MKIFSELIIQFLGRPSAGSTLYIDPGSGSLIIQIILGALVGTAFIIRTFWGKIKNFFGKIRNSSEIDEE